MAEPISFKEVNKVYGPGKNENTDQLPVCVASSEQMGGLYVISRWKLSQEEKERILKTGEVNVLVMGTNIFPMFITSLDPFKDLDYKAIEP